MSEPVEHGILTAQLNTDGTVTITGPFDNEMLSRFLVDKARAEIDRHFAMRAAMAQAQQQRVIPANGGGNAALNPFPGFKRGRG